jgi:nitrate reductase NapAB chaperone NapD
LTKLERKEIEDEELAEEATKSKESLSELLDGIASANPRVKFRSAKILRMISKRNPEMLYSSWDFFVKLLDSENNILKWNAIDIIANLTRVDSYSKFDRLFKKFYSGLLYEGSLITAGHVVSGSSIIVRARPELQHKITKELLKVETVSLPTEECRNILIGHTIKTFDAYLDQIKDKEEIASFVKKQQNNSRRATKAKAEKLLKKLEK